jgi:hypothetical protein
MEPSSGPRLSAYFRDPRMPASLRNRLRRDLACQLVVQGLEPVENSPDWAARRRARGIS